ncbi:hypothetical protein niasHT_025709 [Heterodera trifolii]|uniref:Homeobox protein SIX1 N-terminal SD domain-containing protein n=1 Tax=Heterodera trifolii TaxID=157864 RepID=A0ABD2K8F9_9BILA
MMDFGNFNELHVFLESQKFAREIHPKLKKIWWVVHFLEAKQTLQTSELSPLEKYKVREKHPLPPTILEGQHKNLSPTKMPPAELEKEQDELLEPKEKKKRKETDE